MAKGISVPVTQSGLESSINQAVKSVGPINIPATIDPSAFKNLAQPLGRVSGLATEFEKSIAASNARVLAFGASVGIINGVQNAFSELVRTGIDVQKTLADIAAISGKSGQELSKFGDALFDVAKNTSQSFKTASQAALEFSRQGLSTEETIKRTNDALTLTRFTTLNAAEAVDVLTAAANSFSESGITTAQIINKLIAVDTKFAVSAEDLANGLARAGSIAQEVGVNFDQLNAAITIAQERTARGGAVIGNALKTIFTRIRSDETVKALRSIGVETLNAQGGLRDAIPLLQEVANKIQGLSGGERVQILEAVASKYNINILSALLDDLNNANSKFSEAVAISAGANNQAYERQVELNRTLAAQINGVTVSVGQLFNKLAEIGVTDNLNSLLKFVNDLLTGFNKLLDSEGTGGNIAKGLIKGLSDVFFTVGLPIIGAIFIKLTKDIAQFGVESLKTILGINQQVRERQALEQAVVNTLIRDQEIMATILSLSGNRTKQEEYLLGVYNKQLSALQQVQNIAATVAPALMAGGLSATTGQVRRRGAGGYLPAQEAADVRRGVGGASPSSKVVSIPNFAFGGGKRGTMIANTSEYIVPNFANGGSAIFNQDMAKTYGLPSGAKKISASGGYVPNFARYVYDADRIEPDKNALLKAILASKTKKNLIVGPAGAGKSTYGAGLGSFITNVSQLTDATEIDILSGAARSKDGGLSKNFQQIADAVNTSGGKISYLYAGNMDLYSRRIGRIGSDPMEGDLRSAKQISGSLYAPMNQFDFISKVKNSARNFEMIRGANGYIPNFADYTYYSLNPKYATSGLPSEYSSVRSASNTIAQSQVAEFLKANPNLTQADLYKSKKGLTKTGKTVSSRGPFGAVMLLPSKAEADAVNATSTRQGFAPKDSENQKLADFVQFAAFGIDQNKLKSRSGAQIGNIAEVVKSRITELGASIVNDFVPLSRSPINPKEFADIYDKKGGAAGAAGAVAGSIFEAAVDYALNPIANQKANNSGSTLDVNGISPELKKAFGLEGPNYNGEDKGDYKISQERGRAFADQIIKNRLFVSAAKGFIPNFAKGGPLEDAIAREMAAGIKPSQIRVTQDGRLKNSQNPNGFAVINTRDEPNGKIPNFAKNEDKIRKELLGSGTAQGPLLPKNWSPQIGTTTAAQPSASAPSPTPASSSFDIGTGKLLAAFSALTVASSTLQSTFKDSESGIGAFTAKLTSALAGASSGALLGNLGKDLIGDRGGAGAFGKTLRAAGTALPFVGAAVGGILEIKSQIEAQKAAEETAKQTERAKKFEQELLDLKARSANEEETLTLLKERQSNLSADIVYNTKDQEVANQKLVELASQYAKLIDVNTGDISNQQEAEKIIDAQKQQRDNLVKLKQEEENLRQSRRYGTEEIAKTETNLKRTRDQQVVQERVLTAEAAKRIPIQAKINELQLAFAQGRANDEIRLAKAAADNILQAEQLGEFAKITAVYDNKRAEIQNKINSLGGDAVEDLTTQLASKFSIAAASQDELKTLIEQARVSGNIGDFQEQFAKLGVTNIKLAEELLQNTDNKTKKDKLAFETQLKVLTVNEKLEKTLKLQNEAYEIRKKSIIDSLDNEQELQDVAQKGFRELEDLRQKGPLAQLQNKIARQPFATREDEYNLALLNAQIETYTRNQKISDLVTIDAEKNFQKLRSTFAKTASGLEKSGDFDPLGLSKGFANAKNIQDLTLEFNKLINEISATQFALDEARDQFYTYGEGGVENIQSISNRLEVLKSNYSNLNTELAKYNITQQDSVLIAEELKKQTAELYGFQVQMLKLKKDSPFSAGMLTGMYEISKEADNFSFKMGNEIPLLFRDGLRDAMSAAISQTDDLGLALQNVATGFLKTMQNAFLQNASNNVMLGLQSSFPSIFPQLPSIEKRAKGGLITGGSGYKDDVPAMLMGGEFVMKKSAVQKYGLENLKKMNNGGIFLPGVRGGGAISGYDALRAFASQTTTSGETDILRGGGSSAFINLEDQSSRLSRFALLGDDTINQEIRSAQEQALNIIAEREAYRTQQRKAFQQQLVGTIASAALSAGISKLTSTSKIPSSGPMALGSFTDSISGSTVKSLGPMSLGSFTSAFPRRAYGGMIPRYASGGPVDDIPALLMDGEYVMNRQSTSKYGKRLLDSMNQGKLTRFADGGEVGGTTTTTTESNAKMMGDVSININVSGQASQTESQGNTNQGGIDYKKMSERIKAVVIETINEEKRLGGSLRTR